MWLEELQYLLRRSAGGFLFGVPLLYTVELWSIGASAQYLWLLGALATAFVIVFLLIQTENMRRQLHLQPFELVIESVEALTIGILCAAIALFLLCRITFTTPLSEVLGKIIFEGVSFSFGAALAGSLLARDRSHPAQPIPARSTKHLVTKHLVTKTIVADISPDGISDIITLDTVTSRSASSDTMNSGILNLGTLNPGTMNLDILDLGTLNADTMKPDPIALGITSDTVILDTIIADSTSDIITLDTSISDVASEDIITFDNPISGTHETDQQCDRELDCKLVSQSVPASADQSDQNLDRTTWGETLADLDATLIGAFIIAFNIAPTDEISILSTTIPSLWLLLIMAASLIISYIIVFAAGFPNQIERQQQQGFLQQPLSETLIAYLISLSMAVFMLWFFHQVDATVPWQVWLSDTIVLGLPASIGGAAGRLLA